MIRVDLPALIECLNPICRHALEEASSLCVTQQAGEVTVIHLLFKLLDNPLGDVRLILRQAGIDADDVRQALSEGFNSQNVLDGQYPSFSPLLLELMQEAWLLASVEFHQPAVRGGSLFLATLLSPARYLPMAGIRIFESINRETLRKQFGKLLIDSAESPSLQTTDKTQPASLLRSDESALSKFGHDFTEQARAGKIDPVLCRDDEIDLMIDILSRRRKNNPIIVGDAGVGKSAVVEGLALRIVQGRVPLSLRQVALWGLDLGALQAGASVKGEFEKRLKTVIDEVKSSPQPIILFIDEAHTLIGAGNAAGGSDAANLLKPALARGELRTIAATTWSEYKKYFEKDPALSRRFQLIKLEEPSQEQAVHILRGLRPIYEKAHKIYIGDDALQAAAVLSARYLSGRQLPDKAIDVLDTACARVASALAEPPRRLSSLEHMQHQVDAEIEHLQSDQQMGRPIDPRRLETLAAQKLELLAQIDVLQQAWEKQKALVEEILAVRDRISADVDAPEDGSAQAVAEGSPEEDRAPSLAALVEQLTEVQREGALLHADVGYEQIAQVIADWTGIPANTISSDRMQRLNSLPDVLRERIKGQDDAIDKIHRHLLTSMADLRRPGTPLGVFLLVGPSGVGKTETALGMADAFFGGKQFLTSINMSEYQEKHTVSRLLGSPPGYVGYGEGGILTEAIRQRPYSVVLLDEVEKAHPEVLNIFYQAFDKGEIADGEGRLIDCKNTLFFLTSNLGFDAQDASLMDIGEEPLRQRLMQFFKPALLARMQIVAYRYLDEDVLAEIVDARLARVRRQVLERYEAELSVDETVYNELKSRCTRHENGARMLDASIDGELLPPLSLAILNRLATGHSIATAQLSWDGERFAAAVG